MSGLTLWDEQMLSVFDSDSAVLIAVVIAAVAGAMHAVAPGHGKTLAAATLVGTRGRAVHALALGAAVAGMHTISVSLLAVVWYGLLDVMPEGLGRMTVALQLIAAVTAVVIGAVMLRHQLTGDRRHGHHHVDAPPWTRRGLVALAMSGGLVPSPSAFLILVTGIVSGRLVVAAVLVTAFAAGMAFTLTAVGLIAVAGRDVMAGAAGHLPGLDVVHRRLPLLAAGGVVVGGMVLAGSAIATLRV